MSWVPAVRGSLAMRMTSSGSTGPSNGQVKLVARHNWIRPLSAAAIPSGTVSRLCSVLRPRFARLWASDTERQYWKFTTPRSAARRT